MMFNKNLTKYKYIKKNFKKNMLTLMKFSGKEKKNNYKKLTTETDNSWKSLIKILY